VPRANTSRPVVKSEIAPPVLVKSCGEGVILLSGVSEVLGSVLGVFCVAGSIEDGIGEAGMSTAVAVVVTDRADTSASLTFILQFAANAMVDMERTIRECLIATMIQVIARTVERMAKID